MRLSFLRRLHFPLLLMLTVFPPVLLVLCMAPDVPAQVFALPASCFLLCIPCLALPAKRRLIGAALCSALLFTLSAAILPLKTHPALLLLPAVSAAVLFASLHLASASVQSISPVFYFCGVVSHLITQGVLRSSIIGYAIYAAIHVPLSAASLLYLILLLLTFNRISLDNATLSRQHAPASMRRFNTALTLGFLALSLLLACMPAVVRGAIGAWRLLRGAVSMLGALIMRLLPAGGDFGGTGAAGPMQPIAAEAAVKEPSPFAVIVQKIASLIALLVLIVGIYILTRQLIRLLGRLARHLLSRLQRYMTAVSEDYDDEITDTREEDGEKQTNLMLRLKKRTAANAQPQTPADHIRRRYARLLRKNPKWSESSTARENLPEDSASLYERARYSAHPATKEDADSFLDLTRHL